MRKTKELLFIILTVICIVAITSVCYAEGETKISAETLDLMLNTSRNLYIENRPYSEQVTWTSSNENVATVSENGQVTAVGIGTAIITATVGEQTFNCNVTVEYNSIDIKAKTVDGTEYITDSKVVLVLEKYAQKQLVAEVKDGKYQLVEDANVIWTSTNSSIVTVDNTGKLTAISAGTSTVTATADTLSKSIEVTVLPAPAHTDFSNAVYELPFDLDTDLKISGITPKENSDYYYIITTTPTEPTIELTITGNISFDNTKVSKLSKNLEENFIFQYSTIDKYVELNSDIYLWVYEVVELEDSYYDDNNKHVSYDTKLVVNGENLIKPALPKLHNIIRSFNIGRWKESQDTYIFFRFPSATENRKFKLKIGKVTDQNILNKIHNNDYSGITALLSYAKQDETPVYSENLTTTGENRYIDNNNALFDGQSTLYHKAFYYIYVEFDDENGKYAPIEGVTLAQALIRDYYWDLCVFSDEKIEWTDLTSTPTEVPETTKDDTTATKTIPYTGEGAAIISIIGIVLAVGLTAMVLYRKNSY